LLLEGLSASVPMVIGSAIILDKYALHKASQLVGILNSVITAAMAGAPVLGAWLTAHFHWRLNFMVITFLVGLSFLGSLFFIEETLVPQKRKQFNLGSIAKDYIVLAKSFKFMGYSFISLLPFIAIVVYMSNLSLIFINHLKISTEAFGIYQATTMGTFVVFSALGAKLIAKKGLAFTQNIGSVIAILGIAGLFLTACFSEASPLLICLSMSIFAAGGSCTVGIFGVKALELYPEMKGTASAMMNTVRQLLASVFVLISQITFNGTIMPVAILLFASTCIAVLWYFLLQKKLEVSVPIAL
jgi:DHA1 family bicyclomycin/chloramphenicol resistance-like MFS transporter